MLVGQSCAGQVWTDLLGNCSEKVVLDEKGCGVFACEAKSVSVFVRQDANGRERFAELCRPDMYRL